MSWTAKEAAERRAVLLDALQRHGGNITRAAGQVGVSRPTFYAQAFKLGMGRELGFEADQKGPALPDHAHAARTLKVTEGRWRWARHAAIDQGITTSALVELALDRLRAELEDGA